MKLLRHRRYRYLIGLEDRLKEQEQNLKTALRLAQIKKATGSFDHETNRKIEENLLNKLTFLKKILLT